LNIEGLGRELDPDLDLWKTAKPYLERWMQDQVGWRGFVRSLQREAPYWASTLPQLPRLAHRLLAEDRLAPLERAVQALARENARRNDILSAMLLLFLLALAVTGIALL